MGVKNTVLSALTKKGASISAITSALSNENEEAKKEDKKSKKNK